MSWTPTDEQALVVKAELGTHGVECTGPGEVTCRCREGGWMSWSAFNEHQARAVLVAVGPMIAAQALRDAAGETKTVASSASSSWGADGIVTSDVKFTEVPALPQGAPTLLRARADQIEKEAGR